MGVNIKFSDLYRAPEINPINRKARAIPALNILNMYGRVFFFSWFGFMIAFWAWYTFPPLVSPPTPTQPLDLADHACLGPFREAGSGGWYATKLTNPSSGCTVDGYHPRGLEAHPC